MAILFQLVKRHTLLYLRDKASVFFSFLSVIIIIVMYALFLGKIQSDGMASMASQVPFGIINLESTDWLIGTWIMSGLLTVSTVTVPLGTLGALITDKATKKIDDFYTSPIDRRILALSYLMSSWVVAIFMVLLNLIIGQLYIVLNGGELIGMFDLLKLVGVLMVSIMSFSSFFFYISLFIKTRNAFALLSTMVSTFIGFLGGIYVQIGMMPQTVQYVMNMLPTAHSVSLIRRIYMTDSLNSFWINQNIPEYNDFLNNFGLNVNIFGYDLSSLGMLLSMIIFGIVFYILTVFKLSKSKL